MKIKPLETGKLKAILFIIVKCKNPKYQQIKHTSLYDNISQNHDEMEIYC